MKEYGAIGTVETREYSIAINGNVIGMFTESEADKIYQFASDILNGKDPVTVKKQYTPKGYTCKYHVQKDGKYFVIRLGDEKRHNEKTGHDYYGNKPYLKKDQANVKDYIKEVGKDNIVQLSFINANGRKVIYEGVGFTKKADAEKFIQSLATSFTADGEPITKVSVGKREIIGTITEDMLDE